PRRDAAREPAGDVGNARRRPRDRAAALRPRSGATPYASPIDHATPRYALPTRRNVRLSGTGGGWPADLRGPVGSRNEPGERRYRPPSGARDGCRATALLR